VHARTLLLLGALALAGCRDPLAEVDSIYSTTPQSIYCAANIDTVSGNDLQSVLSGLERAKERGEQIHLYTHRIGVTIPIDFLEQVLARANELDLPFVTYRELAEGKVTGAAVALGFDDQWIDTWYAARDLLRAHGVHATFFVSRLWSFTDLGKEELHALAADGHDIEAHSVNHLNAPDVVADRGLQAWLDDEVAPSIDGLTDDGFDPPVAFAYPFGARTGETDRALLHRVRVIRSVSFSFGAPVSDPCPR